MILIYPCIMLHHLNMSDLNVVQREIYSAHPKWYNVGLELGLQPSDLDGIKASYHSDPSECFREMLKCWLKGSKCPPNWELVVRALKSPTVGETQLSRQVKAKHCLRLYSLQASLEDVPVLKEERQSTKCSSHKKDTSANSQSIAQAQNGELVEEETAEADLHDKYTAPLRKEDSSESTNSISSGTACASSSDETSQPFGCGCRRCSFSRFIEKGCPNPIPSMSSFPYLDTKGLTHSEQQILRGRLLLEFQAITTSFSGLRVATCKSLITRGVTVLELARVLMDLGAFEPSLPQKPLLDERLEDIRGATDVDDVFFILRDYVSFFNYHIIEHIINQLGTSEDKQRLQKYKKELDEYSKRNIFECHSYSVIKKDHADLVMKIDGTFEKFNLKHLHLFQARIAEAIRVSKYTLRLCTVEKGCLQLHYQIPHFVKETIFPLCKAQQEALKKSNVKGLSCGKHHLYCFQEQVESDLDSSFQIKCEHPHKYTSCHSGASGASEGILRTLSSPEGAFTALGDEGEMVTEITAQTTSTLKTSLEEESGVEKKQETNPRRTSWSADSLNLSQKKGTFRSHPVWHTEKVQFGRSGYPSIPQHLEISGGTVAISDEGQLYLISSGNAPRLNTGPTARDSGDVVVVHKLDGNDGGSEIIALQRKSQTYQQKQLQEAYFITSVADTLTVTTKSLKLEDSQWKSEVSTHWRLRSCPDPLNTPDDRKPPRKPTQFVLQSPDHQLSYPKDDRALYFCIEMNNNTPVFKLGNWRKALFFLVSLKDSGELCTS